MYIFYIYICIYRDIYIYIYTTLKNTISYHVSSNKTHAKIKKNAYRIINTSIQRTCNLISNIICKRSINIIYIMTL